MISYYDVDGNKVDSNSSVFDLEQKSLAKQYDSEEFDVYFIRSDSSGLYDPRQGEKVKKFNFIKVGKETFRLYIEFLKTKEVLKYRKAFENWRTGG